jgi:hypothetical protein
LRLCRHRRCGRLLSSALLHEAHHARPHLGVVAHAFRLMVPSPRLVGSGAGRADIGHHLCLSRVPCPPASGTDDTSWILTVESRCMAKLYQLQVKNRPALLVAMMRFFAPDGASISFEGHLGQSNLMTIADATDEERGVLKRGTIFPRPDFIVLPLTAQSLQDIEDSIHAKLPFSGGRGLIHVQIEKDGQLAFAAYDSFHPGTVIASDVIPEEFFEKLVAERVISSYQRAQSPTSPML